MHRLPRLPTGALLTPCERPGKVINITKPLSVFFGGAQLSWGFPGIWIRNSYGPSWVVGFPLGLPAVLHGILCYIAQKAHLFEAPCVSWRLPPFEFQGPGVWPYFVFSEIGPSLGIFPLLS